MRYNLSQISYTHLINVLNIISYVFLIYVVNHKILLIKNTPAFSKQWCYYKFKRRRRRRTTKAEQTNNNNNKQKKNKHTTSLLAKEYLNAVDHMLVWWLIWYAFVRRVGASDNTTKRQTVRCRPVSSAARQRRVVMQHVVAMSHCRSVRIKGLAYKSSDRATSR
jgi:hypothetical protein